jgi:deazaflavin-dependent oxidoreductase (nitroreductase family)
VGLPAFTLTAIGAKSGLPRRLPIFGIHAGEKIILIGSNFGLAHHPAWVHNLRAHPECNVEWHGRSAKYLARETEGDEREKYWDLAVSYYAGYEAYRLRAGKRRIAVMVLEPKKS